MADKTPFSPFVPGRGGLPPHLAGRDEERDGLLALLAYLENGRGAPRDAVLTGPRGNGKTALMRWFEREIRSQGEAVDVVWLTPNEIPDLDALANELTPLGRFDSLRPEALSLSIGVGRLGWELGRRPASLTRLLRARCRQQPLVVLLDEAQNLETEVGGALLNASQSVAAEAPFLLVLAGTPNLPTRLNALSATFWNRAKQIGIGRLEPAAAGEAVTRPLAEQAPPLAITDDALAEIVNESQGYPYFLQIWGDALWRVARKQNLTQIDGGVASVAKVAFDRERSIYYEDRRRELKAQTLLSVAIEVAAAFRDRATLADAELDRIIAVALEADPQDREVLRLQSDLANVGYVWSPPGEADRWEPGIPSLMRYVEAYEAA